MVFSVDVFSITPQKSFVPTSGTKVSGLTSIIKKYHSTSRGNSNSSSMKNNPTATEREYFVTLVSAMESITVYSILRRWSQTYNVRTVAAFHSGELQNYVK